MIGETYEIHDSHDKHRFLFFSEGPNGTIIKSVVYEIIQGNLYNLAFGDITKNGKLSDSVISNNNDLLKIMNTIAETVYKFLDAFPECQIHIRPVDSKRSILYHAIFKRRWNEISEAFYVKGVTGPDRWEDFDPEKKYIAFKLAKRK